MLNEREVFYLANYQSMTSAEMDARLGLSNRMRKVANNLRKFGMLEGETANISHYHTTMIQDGLEHIADKGIRNYCEELGKNYGVKGTKIRTDYAIMKRYGKIE